MYQLQMSISILFVSAEVSYEGAFFPVSVFKLQYSKSLNNLKKAHAFLEFASVFLNSRLTVC